MSSKYSLKQMQIKLYNDIFQNYSDENTYRIIENVCRHNTGSDKCKDIFKKLIISIFFTLTKQKTFKSEKYLNYKIAEFNNYTYTYKNFPKYIIILKMNIPKDIESLKQLLRLLHNDQIVDSRVLILTNELIYEQYSKDYMQKKLYHRIFNNYSDDTIPSIIKEFCKNDFSSKNCTYIFTELVVNIFFSILKDKKFKSREFVKTKVEEFNKASKNFEPTAKLQVNLNKHSDDYKNLIELLYLLQDHTWGIFENARLASLTWEVLQN